MKRLKIGEKIGCAKINNILANPVSSLYIQCLINRKEIMLHTEYLEGVSEVCNQIYRLENVDVLFQCLMMDNMEWEDGRVYGQFSTMYLL